MNYDYLFTKNDTVCYRILSEFNVRTDFTITKSDLGDIFDLTYYQFHKYFDQINTDLAAVSKGTPCYIDDAPNSSWKAFGLNTFTLQKIALVYLNRSPFMMALEYQFFYDNLHTKREFITANYLSSSVFYRALESLERTLKKHHFYQPSSLFSDQEFTIRLHLFQLYYTMYNSVSDPFESINDLITAVIQQIYQVLPVEVGPTSETKLSTFLRIWLLRIFNQHEITADALAQIKLDDRGKQLFESLKTLFADQITLSSTEFNYLYNFLISQGYLGSKIQNQTAASFPSVVQLSKQFMDGILHENVLVDTKLMNTDKLWSRLLQIHLQFTTFYIEPTTFINPNQMKFFSDLYPTFDIAIRKMIGSLQQRTDLHLTSDMAVNLYFSYMFALINSIPPELMKDQVHICVDFSEGSLYTDYVIQSLDSFNHAHLIIDKVVKPETDIYISDFHSPKVKQPQIIWQDPPTAPDWAELADTILATKHAKLIEFYPNAQPFWGGDSSDEK